MDERDRVVRIGAEPGMPAAKAAADIATIVVKGHVTDVHAAVERGMRNFNLRFLISVDASVGDSDSPEHGRGEIGWLRDAVNVPGLTPDFIRNAGIYGAGIEQNTKRQPEAESEAQEGHNHTRMMP